MTPGDHEDILLVRLDENENVVYIVAGSSDDDTANREESPLRKVSPSASSLDE
jgi:hypothetical protein